mmetsp:Transcript_59222/g.171680  ORF Transcript_59222/g.171680 Transcript_59222/m.171680 type:complete len:298 (+) Transcript_59222:792-1685(+)
MRAAKLALHPLDEFDNVVSALRRPSEPALRDAGNFEDVPQLVDADARETVAAQEPLEDGLAIPFKAQRPRAVTEVLKGDEVLVVGVHVLPSPIDVQADARPQGFAKVLQIARFRGVKLVELMAEADLSASGGEVGVSDLARAPQVDVHAPRTEHVVALPLQSLHETHCRRVLVPCGGHRVHGHNPHLESLELREADGGLLTGLHQQCARLQHDLVEELFGVFGVGETSSVQQCHPLRPGEAARAVEGPVAVPASCGIRVLAEEHLAHRIPVVPFRAYPSREGQDGRIRGQALHVLGS